jgi:FkbM family methyltransferase
MLKVDRARINWFGVKPMLRGAILLPGVNAAILAIAPKLMPMDKACRLPVAREFVEFAGGVGNSVRMYEPRRCDVAKDLYWGGGKRRSQADQWAIEAARNLSRDAGLFLDIGAYTGLFALAVARAVPGLRAEAFEIVPENYLMLVRNIVFNGLADQVGANLVGLGETPGTLKMPVRMGLTQAPSSISLETVFDGGIDVPVSTLDERYGDFSGRVVAKLDVEGFEPHVLRGGREFLGRVRPDMVCEVLTSADTGQDIWEVLGPLGYRAWLFTDAGLLARDELRATREGRDWLLSAEDPAVLRARVGGVPFEQHAPRQ